MCKQNIGFLIPRLSTLPYIFFKEIQQEHITLIKSDSEVIFS